jgi:hypothetical protein
MVVYIPTEENLEVSKKGKIFLLICVVVAVIIIIGAILTLI